MMKKYPIPDKKLTTNKEIEAYVVDLVWNLMTWLGIDGYIFNVFTPGEGEFYESENASFSIIVKYPYKKFAISIQQDTIDKIKKADFKTFVWENMERSLLHELTHVLLWRLTELARMRYVTPIDIDNENETVVDHLTNVIYPNIQMKRELAKTPKKELKPKKNGKRRRKNKRMD